MSSRDITCGATFADANHEKKQCASGNSSEVKANLNWNNNTLDDYNFPTDGQKNNISVDLALPIADFRYYKLDASHKSYYPIPTNALDEVSLKAMVIMIYHSLSVIMVVDHHLYVGLILTLWVQLIAMEKPKVVNYHY